MTTDPATRESSRRALFVTIVIAQMLLCAPAAWSACGDGEIDAGEMCDDANLADGDCCTSSCQRPTGCFATDRSYLLIRDKGDDRDDRLYWRLFRGESTFEDWGDPTADTSYSFCLWDDDELKVDTRIEAGGVCQPRRDCWRVVGRSLPTAYTYFDKPTNAWGIQRVLIASQQPPTNAYISLRARDVDLPLPGPVAFDQYFNQTSGVTVQFLRGDAPVCWEATFPTNQLNYAKKFRALLTPNTQ